MELKLHPIKIDPEDPFSNDKLERSAEIENLSQLVRNVNSPAVLAINSRWGTGKTTFIKMWEAHLAGESINTLYFNAWATDFSPDPLVAFLGEMNDGLEGLIGNSTKSKKAWAKTKKVGEQIARRGAPALIRIATVGIIDADKVVEEELSKSLQSLAGDTLDEYLKQKNAIASFKESLSALIQTSGNDEPVVIFIDEMDRCRPDYAISLLERIKHLFDIPGLVFVLALDKEQLGHSVGAVYGQNIDADGYIRRFIDFEYRLRNPALEPYIDSLFSALEMDKFFRRREKYSEFRYDRDELKNTFIFLAKCHTLSLREVEQLLSRINLIFCATKENQYLFPTLVAFLVITKERFHTIYAGFTDESGSEDEIINHLYGLCSGMDMSENHECALIESYLIASKRSRRDQERSSVLRHKQRLEDEDTPVEQRQYSQRVLEIAEHLIRGGRGVTLSYVTEKIELLGQFQFTENNE